MLQHTALSGTFRQFDKQLSQNRYLHSLNQLSLLVLLQVVVK